MSDVTLTFSAQDQEVAAACRRMAGDLAKVEAAGQRVAKSFGSAAGGGLLKAFGAFQAGRQLVGFAGSAMAEYAKRTNEGAIAQARFNNEMVRMKVSLGGSLSYIYGIGASAVGALRSSQEAVTDYAAAWDEGGDTGKNYKMRRDAAKAARGLDAREFARQQVLPFFIENYSAFANAQSGGPKIQDRLALEQSRYEKQMKDLNAMRSGGLIEDLGGAAEYDRMESDLRKRHQFETFRIEREEATKKDTVKNALSTAKQEDEIRMKRLKGYNHEADIAQQRLATEQQIFKVMHDETMDLNDRVAEQYRLMQVGDAMIQQMEQMPVGRIKGNVSLGDGLNNAANFARTFYGIQNGGGSDSKANEQKVILKDISTSLKSIDRKIGNGAVYA